MSEILKGTILEQARGLPAGRLVSLVGQDGVPLKSDEEGRLTTQEPILHDDVLGIEALHNKIEALDSSLDSNSEGFPSIKNAVDSVNDKLDDGSNGLPSIKTKIDSVITILGGGSSNATYNFPANNTENKIIEFMKTSTYSIKSLFIDMNNFSDGKTITIKIYQKIDGSNYRVIDEMEYSSTVEKVAYLTNLDNISNHVKVGITVDVAESSAINLPLTYNVVDF